jgi:P27 family predicted phage terminase small subunit
MSGNKRGRAPTPTKLRLLHGEHRPSRINANEPVPAAMEPVAPEWFTVEARAVWDRVTYQLKMMELLTAADQDALVVYCEAVVNYEAAVKLVSKAGLLIRGRDGNVVKNPAVQMVRDFGATIRVMSGEFGLTPAARVGLSTKSNPSAAAGAERLLS